MRISDSEMEIMRLIWNSGRPVSAAWLMAGLSEKNWKQTTLLTFLSRLADKGAVTVTKDGRTNLYTAAIGCEQYKAQETEQFVRQIHGGSVKSLFAALATSEQLDESDLEELRRLLDGR
ncbi:MAG: BlaI/MecI/CopY family transcriptional regulator [Acetanaerobacterium sp.]